MDQTSNRKKVEIERYKRLEFAVNELAALKTKSEVKQGLEKNFYVRSNKPKK